MNDFVLNGYIVSAFLLVFGIVQLWVGAQLPTPPDERKMSIKRMFSLRFFLFLFGAFYLFLCFLFLYTTLGSSLFLSNDPPCQLIVSNMSTSGSVTSINYVSSCATTTVPSSIERLYVILSYVLMLQMILAVIAMLVAIMRWMIKW